MTVVSRHDSSVQPSLTEPRLSVHCLTLVEGVGEGEGITVNPDVEGDVAWINKDVEVVVTLAVKPLAVFSDVAVDVLQSLDLALEGGAGVLRRGGWHGRRLGTRR